MRTYTDKVVKRHLPKTEMRKKSRGRRISKLHTTILIIRRIHLVVMASQSISQMTICRSDKGEPK